MNDTTIVQFPAGEYWFGSWSGIPRSEQILEKEQVYYQKEVPVAATVLNDGERWAWTAVLDDNLNWLAKTEAECQHGIFHKSLENGKDSGPLDGSWHTFDQPVQVTIFPGANGEKNCFFALRVENTNGFVWGVDTSAFHWVIVEPQDVRNDKAGIQRIGEKLGVKKCIKQCEIMIDLHKRGFYHEPDPAKEIQENEQYIKWLQEKL
ncbi:unnamed protein product [Didymodactylos carnosus]|uniref:Uncharacterized protein n=1 Tax=Didymodactylos carnosus TaxID=1234261 RepID=A0A815EGD9_9BILA|nr:unnamed protein product [Didymodactylos carnosus]CAF1310064.1 unnamed protein product [Didymodactylos carnosus]CAF3937914.1 unnamed protein product [Didymodactylos carnosus]CAF4146563.1 unnamed protein product [Didymodactylos carnosus]